MTESRHISHIPTNQWAHDPTFDLDGLCHCDPAPEPEPIGECPQCRRLALSHVRILNPKPKGRP